LAGSFKFKGTIKRKPMINSGIGEVPGEVMDALHYWWYHAKRGDKFEIECELEV